MRTITLIIIHCSATCEDRPFTEQALETAHRQRGFDGTGYHFYIRRDGRILTTRSPERPGAHARGYNAHSIGICYEGGLDHYGMPKDTRTEWQRHSLRVLVRTLLLDLPRRPSGGTSRPEPRPQRQRRGGTHGMDKAMPLLRGEEGEVVGGQPGKKSSKKRTGKKSSGKRTEKKSSGRSIGKKNRKQASGKIRKV